MTHDGKTSVFVFLFTLHDGLSAVVVSGERFLVGDITHTMKCKRWLIREQCAVCHVSRPRPVKNLWLFNHLIWHSEHLKMSCSLTLALDLRGQAEPSCWLVPTVGCTILRCGVDQHYYWQSYRTVQTRLSKLVTGRFPNCPPETLKT